MLAEMTSLITSTKAAYDIAKGVSTLQSEVDRNQAVSKILEVLVSVQFQASSVLAKMNELEVEKHELTKKLLELESWSKTEKKYQLKEIASGVFIYEHQPVNESSEPLHWLCATCFQDRQKSILQRKQKSVGGIIYICHKCQSEIRDHSQATPPKRNNYSRGGSSGGWMGV